MKKNGRPFKEINWDIVEKYIEYGSSGIEIAGKFRMQPDTFYRRFKQKYGCAFQDYKGNTHEGGKADLRAMLWAKTLNNKAPGNAQLLLFMAKCILGFKEPEISHNLAANQTQIDQTHTIMMLQHQLSEEKSKNGNQN